MINSTFGQATVGVALFVQRNTKPSTHMRCMITANRRASATMAFFGPRRLATFIAQAFNDDHFIAAHKVAEAWESEVVSSDRNGEQHLFGFETFFNPHEALTLGHWLRPHAAAVAIRSF
jgi:hypothetical protein